ncbi:MAG: hypothetical protein AAFN77_19050 [Planctomycetota bacterium]
MSDNLLFEPSLFEIKFGGYRVAASTALSDATLLPMVRNYKRTVASRMVPLAKDDIGRKIADAEYYVSRKIDGEFSALIYRNGDLLTLNPGGTVRIGMPWQNEAKALLDQANVSDVIIAGELYVDIDDRRPRVHDVVSVARQPKSDEELSKIKFAVFDVIAIDGELVVRPYADSFDQVKQVFGDGKAIHPVETEVIKGHRSVEKQFDRWVVDENAEGLVVRSDSAGSFKVKPRHNVDAVVIGFTESTDDRKGMLHDLLLGVVRADGSVHVLCRVGGGFSDDQRREMLSDLEDMVVESEYAEVNSDHVAYQMVEPKLIAEISCLDMISQNTRGGPVNRMVLNFNASEQRYEVVRRMPLVSVISPQFIRIRDDKQFNPTDVRISQVTDLVPVAMAEVDASELTMAKSTIEKREVYTKPYRGETSIRKFLMWKTNKETDDNEFPAYVIHYTDFSPTRKAPLAREVRVSNSKEQIESLWEELKKANIKKGWELYETKD